MPAVLFVSTLYCWSFQSRQGKMNVPKLQVGEWFECSLIRYKSFMWLAPTQLWDIFFSIFWARCYSYLSWPGGCCCPRWAGTSWLSPQSCCTSAPPSSASPEGGRHRHVRVTFWLRSPHDCYSETAPDIWRRTLDVGGLTLSCTASCAGRRSGNGTDSLQIFSSSALNC